MQPSLLSVPDNEAFLSNYSQPEYVFELMSGKAFVPTGFRVNSKGKREGNGFPISQGLVMFSNSLDDLMHTK